MLKAPPTQSLFLPTISSGSPWRSSAACLRCSILCMACWENGVGRAISANFRCNSTCYRQKSVTFSSPWSLVVVVVVLFACLGVLGGRGCPLIEFFVRAFSHFCQSFSFHQTVYLLDLAFKTKYLSIFALKQHCSPRLKPLSIAASKACH